MKAILFWNLVRPCSSPNLNLIKVSPTRAFGSDLSFHINWICLFITIGFVFSQQLELSFQNIIRFTFSQELYYIFNTITLKFSQYLECQSHIACFISSIQFDVSLSLTFTSCSILQMWPHQGGGWADMQKWTFYEPTFTHDRHGPDLQHIFHKITVISLIFILVEESAPET